MQASQLSVSEVAEAAAGLAELGLTSATAARAWEEPEPWSFTRLDPTSAGFFFVQVGANCGSPDCVAPEFRCGEPIWADSRKHH